MSAESVAVAREAFEAMVAVIGDDARQAEWGEEYLAADVEWHEDPGLPGATDRIGRDAALAIGRSPTGEVPTEYRWAVVVRVREGMLAFVRAYLSRDEALESAGLRAAG